MIVLGLLLAKWRTLLLVRPLVSLARRIPAVAEAFELEGVPCDGSDAMASARISVLALACWRWFGHGLQVFEAASEV